MPITYYNDASVWRKLKGIFYNDGGVWRNLKAAWYNDGGVWRKVFQAFTLATGQAWSYAGLQPAAAVVTFNTDGSTTDSTTTGTQPNWGNPLSTGIGSSYWIMFHRTAGANASTAGAEDTWRALSSAQGIGFTAINAIRSGTWTVQIATDSVGGGAVTVGTVQCNIAPA